MSKQSKRKAIKRKRRNQKKKSRAMKNSSVPPELTSKLTLCYTAEMSEALLENFLSDFYETHTSDVTIIEKTEKSYKTYTLKLSTKNSYDTESLVELLANGWMASRWSTHLKKVI